MKNLFGLLFICALFSLASCGGDSCDENFAGTYTGTNDCAGAVVDAEVTITGEDGNYAITGLYTEDLDQDDCTLSFEKTLLGVGEKVTITMTDSLTLRIVQEEAATGVVLCTFTGTK